MPALSFATWRGISTGWGPEGNDYTDQSLWFLDMFLSKEELAVQVAEIDCVKVDDVNFTEAGEDKVLQKLAANSTSTNHQHSRLQIR